MGEDAVSCAGSSDVRFVPIADIKAARLPPASRIQCAGWL